MEIKYVYVKTRAEFGKQCIFDVCGPNLDEEIPPNPRTMNDYIDKDPLERGVQFSEKFAVHEAQTMEVTTKSSGMYHYEGGWPKEINPKDEEATARFRRRVEKDDEWGPKMLNLFQMMEHNVLQNSAVDIHRHYFDDMLPTDLVKRRALRTANVYADPEEPPRPVSGISWSPDVTPRIAVSYSYEQFAPAIDYSNKVYIWDLDNPNAPSSALETFHPAVITEFNPRDRSILASGLMSGQVCNWDIRTGTTPVQISHRQFSHRCSVNGVRWVSTKTNTEFYSSSSEGRVMWWETRNLRRPMETLIFDFLDSNNPDLDNAIGVSSMDYGPSIGTKFMFGLENGLVISGSRKAKTLAERLAARFGSHDGPVIALDRNSFNPKLFLTVGDWTAKVWAEDTREDSLVETRFLSSQPTGGCWNKQRPSMFYMITADGDLETWDMLEGMSGPVLKNRLCEERLTRLAAHEENGLLAVGSYDGRVYLVEPTEALMLFDRTDRNNFGAYIERCSRYTKAIDSRIKEVRVTRSMVINIEPEVAEKDGKTKKKGKGGDKKVRLDKAERERLAELEKDEEEGKDPGNKQTEKKDTDKKEPEKKEKPMKEGEKKEKSKKGSKKHTDKGPEEAGGKLKVDTEKGGTSDADKGRKSIQKGRKSAVPTDKGRKSAVPTDKGRKSAVPTEKGRRSTDKGRRSIDRARKSMSKDKRRLKDEIPELFEHEERYFSIVEAEKEQYDLDDEAYRLWTLWESSSKKEEFEIAEKKELEEAQLEAQESKRTKLLAKFKSFTRGKAAKEEPKDKDEATAKTSDGAEESLRKGRKQTKKGLTLKVGRRKSGIVKHSKLCKKICKPKVCCPDVDMDRGTSEDDIRCREKSVIKLSTSTAKMLEQKLDLKEKKDGESRRSTDQNGQLTYRVSSASAKDPLKRKKKCTGAEKIPMLADVLEPLTEIADEAMKAKKAARDLRKHLYKGTWDTRSSRALRAVLSSIRKKKIPKDSLALSKLMRDKSKEDTKAASAPKKLRAFDPCAPITPYPYSIPKRNSGQSKTGKSAGSSKKAKKSNDSENPDTPRIYPRFSEFHAAQ